MIKKYLWMVFLLAGWQAAWGFSYLGPETANLPNKADAWETTSIGYDLGIDVGTPRDIGQEYRRNIPIIYYAYDPSFLTFFGSNGVVAVDSAMAVMNNLPNVDQLDPTQYPFDSQGYNYEAMSLYMYDLKSTTLYLLVEQMGLAQPERYSWTLQSRMTTGAACPADVEYLVIQRNFATTNVPDTQIQYSPYVNNLLYTYAIDELCPPNNPLAYTIPYSLDPLADQYTSVASGLLYNFGGLQYGGFYTGLTFDDVSGLKVLLSTNTINQERVTGSNLMTDSTNYATGEVLFPANTTTTNNTFGYGTFNLGSLLQAAATTAPANLPALFPGLVVNTSGYYFYRTNVPTVTAAYAPPGNGYPYGSPQRLVVTTNYTTMIATQYITTFANIIVNNYYSNTPALLQTIATGVPNGAPYGSPVTSKTNYTSITLNEPSGDFYVLPQFAGTNLCGSGVIYTILANVTYATNLIVSAATNAPLAVTNTTGTTSITNAGYTYTQSLITWYTNYIYVGYPVTCASTANPANLYEGIGHVQFVREDYDSLLGQVFQPETFNYSMVAVTNSQYITQNFTRTVTAPEIVMVASDVLNNNYVTRNLSFDTSQAIAGEAGPGAILPITDFTFNTDVNTFYNGEPVDANPIPASGYLPNQSTAYFPPYLTWASYDATTNLPILYPSGADLQNLANQMLVLVSPSSLPGGTNGVFYDQQFTATTTRYSSWSWSAANLPPGLTLTNTLPSFSPNNVGVLSGVPIDQTGVNAPRTFDITVTLTGILSNAAQTNSVQWTYPLTIY